MPKGIIPLENIRVRPVEDRDGKQFVFEIYSEMAEIIKGCKTDSNGTVVQGNHKYYRFVGAENIITSPVCLLCGWGGRSNDICGYCSPRSLTTNSCPV